MTLEGWQKVLKLSKMFNENEIQHRAIAAISEFKIDPVDKILLAKEFAVDVWLAPCYESLSVQDAGLTDLDYERLGAETSFRIMRSREAVLKVVISSLKNTDPWYGRSSAAQQSTTLPASVISEIVEKMMWPEREAQRLAEAQKAAEEAARAAEAATRMEEAAKFHATLEKHLEAARNTEADVVAAAAKLEEAKAMHIEATKYAKETAAKAHASLLMTDVGSGESNILWGLGHPNLFVAPIEEPHDSLADIAKSDVSLKKKKGKKK